MDDDDYNRFRPHWKKQQDRQHSNLVLWILGWIVVAMLLMMVLL